MSLPTQNDVHAVNPVLTNMLVGYQQADSRFVASRVFPVVPVASNAGTYYIFTKKYWFMNNMQMRAPGQQYARGDFGVETTTYSTVQWALSKPVADEDRAASQVPLDLETAAVRWLAQQSLIRKEVSFSTDFMKTSVWTTDDSNSTTDWDDYTSGDPRSDVLTAIRTVSNLTGLKPNTMVIGSIVEQALLLHPDILDVLKYTTVANVGNVRAALATVLGVQNIYVGEAVYANINEAATFSATNIIDDDALICYVTPSPGIFEASAGYTFAWAPGGGTGVVMSQRDDLNDSDLVKTKEQWDQKAVSADCGYFFSDVV